MPDTIATGLTASEIHELKNFGSRLTALGVNFAVCDFEGRPLLFCKTGVFETDPARLAKIACDCLKHPDKKNKSQDDSSAAGRYISSILVPLTGEKKQTGIAVVIDLGNTPDMNNQQQLCPYNPLKAWKLAPALRLHRFRDQKYTIKYILKMINS